MSKYKILIVDDEHELVKIIKHMLESNGMEVFCAYDGMHAIESAHKNNPDLIILDVRLPLGSGHDVLSSLKSNPDTETIPVLVYSAVQLPGLKEEFISKGAIGFLQKPYEAEALLEKVTQHASQAAQQVKRRVLIVDDEHELVTVLKHTLESNGFDVVSAFDGVRAIEIAVKQKFDLVILDVNLPAGMGNTVLNALRSNPDTDSVPILVLTAVKKPGLREEMLALGAQEFVQKPYKAPEFLDIIKRLSSGKSDFDTQEDSIDRVSM